MFVEASIVLVTFEAIVIIIIINMLKQSNLAIFGKLRIGFHLLVNCQGLWGLYQQHSEQYHDCLEQGNNMSEEDENNLKLLDANGTIIVWCRLILIIIQLLFAILNSPMNTSACRSRKKKVQGH